MMRRSLMKGLLASALLAAGMTAQAAPEGTLTVVVPHFGRELLDMGKTTTQDLQYTGHINEPLVGTAPDGSLNPQRGLAKSWTMSADARTFDFVLREGVHWHDGKPFTADDVVFSLWDRYRAKDANCTFCRFLQSVESVTAVDDLNVRIVLKQADPAFAAILSGRDGDLRILPRHNYRAVDDGYEMISDPIGTGPWKFVSFSRGVDMRLAANTDYWDKDRVPEFADMVLIPRAQSSTRLSMVRSGEADMAFVDPRNADDARAANLRVLNLKGGSLTTLTFLGCWQEAMLCHQTAFREALVHAIDMDAIVKAVYPEGTAERMATTFWTPQAIGFDPALKPYAYDPARSQALLKEIGYKGTPVKLWAVRTNSLPEAPELVEMIEGYLRAAGFVTEVTPMEFGAFRPRYASNPQQFETRYAAHLYLDSPGPRPTVLPNIRVSLISQEAGGLIQAYWNLPKIDAEWKALVTKTNLDDLGASLLALNRDIYSEYNDLPVAMRNQVAVVGPRVGGWTPSDFGLAWHLETVTRKQ